MINDLFACKKTSNFIPLSLSPFFFFFFLNNELSFKIFREVEENFLWCEIMSILVLGVDSWMNKNEPNVRKEMTSSGFILFERASVFDKTYCYWTVVAKIVYMQKTYYTNYYTRVHVLLFFFFTFTLTSSFMHFPLHEINLLFKFDFHSHVQSWIHIFMLKLEVVYFLFSDSYSWLTVSTWHVL